MNLAVSEHSAKEWMEKYERAMALTKNARMHAQKVSRSVVDIGLAAATGVGDGFLQARKPTIMGKDSGLVLGSIAAGFVLADAVDGMDREAVSIAGTLIGCGLSRLTLKGVQEHDAKKAA